MGNANLSRPFQGLAMRLVHFSKEPLGEIVSVPEQVPGMKPRGLWVSDETGGGWSKWCESEQFQLDRLALAHEVKLAPQANILFLRDAEAIDVFTLGYRSDILDKHGPPIKSVKVGDKEFKFENNIFIDWATVAKKYQGIIITPYIYERRLSIFHDCPDTSWYYGWDCASGCIWDATAIESVA